MKPLSIGHRGAAGHAPENTIAALKEGIRLGADLVEFDVQRTSDGEIVLFHDRTLKRITGRFGLLCNTEMRVLQTLDAGRSEKIPRLSEALEAIQETDRRVGAMIEMKDRDIAPEVCSIVDSVGFGGPVIYASFRREDLLDVRRIRPNAQTLALVEAMPADGTAFAAAARATHAGLPLDGIDEKYVRALQAGNIQVFVYTVDDARDIARVRSMGVDGVISNYPERRRYL